MMSQSRVSTAELAELLQALGEPTRLRILNLMAAGEVCVCYFVEVLGEPQAKISRHLAYLRRAGLVTARRDGKWIHYSLAQDLPLPVAGVLQQILHIVANDRESRRERESLMQLCCAPRLPAALRDAPRPRLT